MTDPKAPPARGVFAISASQLKLWQLCPRSWFLKHVLRAPDDAGAGGLYLTRGNDFDRLVQLHVRDGVTGDTGAPKLANRQLYAAKRHLPEHRGAEVQFAYDIDAGGFRVRGKPDIRRRGWIQDTKTTSDRGPNRGAAEDRPPYALTDAHTPGGNLRPLSEDVQARLYAWCEFQLDPTLTNVYAQWIYVSKADCPVCWTSSTDFDRAYTEEWFDRVVRSAVAEMVRLAAEYDDGEPGGLTALDVGANSDSCRRCFVRAACPGPFEGVNVYGIKKGDPINMAFDLSKLRATPAPAVATPPPAPTPAVLINRPATQRPTANQGVTVSGSFGPAAEMAARARDTENALVVHSVEGPGAAFVQLEYVTPDDSANAPSDITEETPPAPKARRGRPRKSSTAEGSVTAPSTPVVADDTDPKAPAAAPTASGCAPSVGALAVAVSALISAVRSLETTGRTGCYLQDAEEALRAGGVS